MSDETPAPEPPPDIPYRFERTHVSNAQAVVILRLEATTCDLLLDVRVKLTVELGACQLPMREVLQLFSRHPASVA